ncbi:MAG: SGNH/GDSL hydrolase family protein [bacterium]
MESETKPALSPSGWRTKIWWIISICISILIIGLGIWFYLWLGNEKQVSDTAEKSPTQTKEESGDLVALGDSITQANGLSTEMGSDNPEYSFSTGTEINSFYLYLRNQGNNLQPVNLSISGATTQDALKEQVPKVADYDPKYITVLLGANDVLGGFTISEFRRNLQSIINKIKNDDTTILIGSIPNLIKMQTANYPICEENSFDAEIQQPAEAYIQAFNTIIYDLASDNYLIYVDIFPILGKNEVSEHDCTHPNISGQEKIAQEFIKALK